MIMSSVMRTCALAAAISGVACGATTRTPAPTTSPVSTAPEQVSSNRPGEIPVGQELRVLLETPLSSETSTVEQRFDATTVVDVMQNGRVLIPAGSLVRGVVSD